MGSATRRGCTSTARRDEPACCRRGGGRAGRDYERGVYAARVAEGVRGGRGKALDVGVRVENARHRAVIYVCADVIAASQYALGRRAPQWAGHGRRPRRRRPPDPRPVVHVHYLRRVFCACQDAIA
ncbi:hypothetical protein VHUM_04220 [Vanrija humicola]|uniref:Uncharacterized protein n=1 Tax=Vanrija humicola TaxID=5417 RepID=A0A7D8UYW2_VANHU|nr:hypothetical protein VHUM_04220 [Vanrija humicola]